MKISLLAAAAVVTMGLSGAAFAVPTYIVDDFTATPPNPFSAVLQNQGDEARDNADGSYEAYSIAGIGFSRRVLFQNLVDTNNSLLTGNATLEIAGGTLNLVNGTNVRSKVTLDYNITNLDALVSDFNSVQFSVLFADGVNGTPLPTIDTYINGVLFGHWNIDDDPVNQGNMNAAGFSLLGSQLMGVNDILTIVIDGPSGMDLEIDQVAVDVPEPAMIGLFGLGLAGLGFARRRKN